MKIYILLFVLLVAACGATVGKPIATAQVAQIVKGSTTQAQIETWFGKAYSTGLTGDGKLFMVYVHSKSKGRAANYVPMGAVVAGGVDTQTQTLQVVVDRNTGIVADYIFNDSTSEINTGVLNQE